MQYFAIVENSSLKNRTRPIDFIVMPGVIRSFTIDALAEFLKWTGTRRGLRISEGFLYLKGKREPSDKSEKVKFILSPFAEILWDAEDKTINPLVSNR